MVSVIGACSLLRRGVSPCVWSRRGPWGVAVAPPISPYTGPGWSPPFCRMPLELRSVFYVLLCDIPPVFMAIIWTSFTDSCMSLARHPPYGVVPWTLAWRVTRWTSCPPPRYSGPLSFALTYGHDSRVLMPPAIDIVWRWPCLPRLRWF